MPHEAEEGVRRTPGVGGRIPRGDDSAEGVERQLLLLRAQLRHPGLRRALGARVPGQASLGRTRVHIHPVCLQSPSASTLPESPLATGLRATQSCALALRLVYLMAAPLWP